MATITITVCCSRCARRLRGYPVATGYAVNRHKHPDGAWCLGHRMTDHVIIEPTPDGAR